MFHFPIFRGENLSRSVEACTSNRYARSRFVFPQVIERLLLVLRAEQADDFATRLTDELYRKECFVWPASRLGRFLQPCSCAEAAHRRSASPQVAFWCYTGRTSAPQIAEVLWSWPRVETSRCGCPPMTKPVTRRHDP